MHEWALAEAVISAAVKVSQEEKLSEIDELSVRMGELQQIDMEAFNFALNEAMKSRKSLMGKAGINIEKEEAVFECRVCGHKWGFEELKKELDEEEFEFVHFVPEAAHTYVRCGKCKSPDFQVVKGRGVWLDAVTGKRGDD